MVRDRQKGHMSMDITDTTYTGTLQISVVSALGMSPISGATVTISYTGDPDSPIETLTTGSATERTVFISGDYGTALFGIQHSGDRRRL